MSTENTWGTKHNHPSSIPNSWNRNGHIGQYSGQATLTNKINGARDKASLDFNEHVHLKTLKTNEK